MRSDSIVDKFLEKTIKSERIFTGKVLALDVETVELPDGNLNTREIIRHPGAVAILPIDENGNIIMVRQFRKALDQSILEIPAGKLELNEDSLDCAKRELIEEVGKSASYWSLLLSVWSAPGFTDEKIHIYLAKDFQETIGTPDEDEFLQVESYSPEKIEMMVESGKINDTKTILALLAAGIIKPLKEKR